MVSCLSALLTLSTHHPYKRTQLETRPRSCMEDTRPSPHGSHRSTGTVAPIRLHAATLRASGIWPCMVHINGDSTELLHPVRHELLATDPAGPSPSIDALMISMQRIVPSPFQDHLGRRNYLFQLGSM
jgi:hypothetical protein